MFRNEVIVSEEDKQKVVELLTEVNKILEPYPYFNPEYAGDYTVTTISRAKGFAKDALKWCSYLHTASEEGLDT